ncbi:MAG: aliphatic sulfonate ABC transporter substrate-binding protein [Firmicutes bacterium]|jgi:sulfonate transport system substrate-binding protein|nr:aliphatic sulfonate ABC transporter substrate-binding protein [Bacillota bacterium]
MKQNKNWKASAALALTVIIMLTLGATYAMAAEKLTVSYNPMPLNVPSIVMKEMGFLEESMGELGVEVEYKSFLAGYQMTEAMAAGELDIAPVMGGTSTITSYAGGRDLQVFAAYGQAPAGFAIAVKADSPVESIQELEGRTVGVPVGTEAHYLLGKALEEAGLELKEVQTANMLVPDAVTALMAGHIDAAAVVEPVLSRLQTAGQIRVLRDGVGLMPGLTVMTARRDILEQRPDIMAAFLKAHNRSLRYMEDNPEETIELVAQETKLPAELVQKIMAKYTFAPQLTPELAASLDNTAAFLLAVGIIREPVDLEGLINFTVLDSVQ